MMFSIILAVAMSAGNSEFDRAAVNGAAEIAIGRVRASLVANGPAAGLMRDVMLADPDAAEKRSEAERICRASYEQALSATLTREASAIRERLGIADGEPVRFAENDLASAMKGFDAAFDRERREACEIQAKKIAGNVRPPEAEIGVRNEDELRNELVAKVVSQQRAAVFEENRRYVSETIVDPILAAARKELARQREYLMRTRCDAYSPSALERELAANLEANVAERRKKSTDPASEWGVFPVVIRDAVPQVAERRTLDRVTSCIDEVEVKVDSGSLSAAIASDRVAHRRRAESEKLFRGRFVDQVSQGAVNKVISEAPAAERDEFAAYVRARTASPVVAKAVEARVRRELMPRLAKAREELAFADAAETWPELLDGTWYPEGALADDFAARSDYAKAVRSWRQSPGLAALAAAADGRQLLEESEQLADQKVAKAFELARSAINAQNAIVNESVPQVLGDAKNRKASWFRSTPDLKAIVGMLTDAVSDRWGEVRETVLWGNDERPENATEQHRELFPSVRKRIELVAKSILEEMNKPEERPEEKPEEPPEETPPEEIPPEEAEYVISVKRSGDKVEIGLKEGKKPILERTSGADMKSFSGSMRELSEKLGSEILKLK